MTISSMSSLFFLSRYPRRTRYTVAYLLYLLMPMMAGCDPALNWREVRSNDASYTVLLPAKPASFERSVDLDGLQVAMSMTAAEVDGTSFAVATAVVADEAQRISALMAMQTAMTRNIQGEITEQKMITMKNGATAVQIHATGKAARDGKPLALFARFLVHGTRVFQVVALGPKEKLDAETADTFLSSFVLH
jgi:hypothetical protein